MAKVKPKKHLKKRGLDNKQDLLLKDLQLFRSSFGSAGIVPTPNEPLKYHDELEVEVLMLSSSGEGLGMAMGKILFVPYCLPGELVRAKVYKVNEYIFTVYVRTHIMTDLVKVLRPSNKRVEPKCRYFASCSGCQLQHLSYDDQIAFKNEIVRRAFKEIESRNN